MVLSQERGCLEVGRGAVSGSTARVQIPREETPRAKAQKSCRGGTILEDIPGIEEPVAEPEKRGALQERWVPRESGYHV